MDNENKNELNNTNQNTIDNNITLNQVINSEINTNVEQTNQMSEVNEETNSLSAAINNQINNQSFDSIPNINISEEISNEIIDEGNNINSVNNDSNGILNNKVENNSKKTYLSDDELLFNFVQKNYDKFVTRKFNFSAFFFSVFYLLYRKMYGYSFIVIAISILVSIFVRDELILCGSMLLICLLLGLFANKLYLSHARNKIDNIRYNHPYVDNEVLLLVCKKKGGTSIVSVIVGLIVNLLVVVGIFIAFCVVFLKIPFSSIFNKIVNDYFKIPTSGFGFDFGKGKDEKQYNPGTYHGKYSGAIWFNSINMKNEFSVTMPSNFEDKTLYNTIEYKYDDFFEGEECKFKLFSVEGYTSASQFIEEVKQYGRDSSSVISTEKINGVDWIKTSFHNSFGEEYFYALEKKGVVFVANYSNEKSEKGICETAHQTIIKSIKSK